MTDQGYIAKLEAAILDLYDAQPSDWDGVSAQTELLVEKLRSARGDFKFEMQLHKS